MREFIRKLREEVSTEVDRPCNIHFRSIGFDKNNIGDTENYSIKIRFDVEYFFICKFTNEWKRVTSVVEKRIEVRDLIKTEMINNMNKLKKIHEVLQK